ASAVDSGAGIDRAARDRSLDSRDRRPAGGGTGRRGGSARNQETVPLRGFTESTRGNRFIPRARFDSSGLQNRPLDKGPGLTERRGSGSTILQGEPPCL